MPEQVPLISAVPFGLFSLLLSLGESA
jgi:hypothetical protein